MKKIHIGVDFDNTLVCYDEVFYQAALEQNLIPLAIPRSKTDVRNYFRSIGKEEEWTRLQGYVYGARMDLARPYPGVDFFFSLCQKMEIQVSIISHKTKKPFLGPPYDLHEAAKNWLLQQPFFHKEIDVFFEPTLKEKLERIAAAGCDFFIDDLPELLTEPKFPSHVKKILFDPLNLYPPSSEWLTLQSWDRIPSIPKAFLSF